ncbi:hypothetical protein D3C73_1011750 [compost metagenome]
MCQLIYFKGENHWYFIGYICLLKRTFFAFMKKKSFNLAIQHDMPQLRFLKVRIDMDKHSTNFHDG